MPNTAHFAQAGSVLKRVAGGATSTAPAAPPGPTVGAPAIPARAAGLGYSLAFYDDFSTLDTSVWRTNGTGSSVDGPDGGTNDGGNREEQWYHPGQVSASGGLLRLRVSNSPYTATRLSATDGRYTHLPNDGAGHPVFPYRSGAVCSMPDPANGVTGRTFGPGCFLEAEVNVPSAFGTWSAFWLMPYPAQTWPNGGEVDWFEHVGDKAWDGNPGLSYRENLTSNLHYPTVDGVTNGPYGFKRVDGTAGYPGVPFYQGFHKIGGLWLNDRIEFYVDGVKFHEIIDARKVPQGQMHLILNIAMGGNFPGPVGLNAIRALPFEMQVNYVAVWAA